MKSFLLTAVVLGCAGWAPAQPNPGKTVPVTIPCPPPCPPGSCSCTYEIVTRYTYNPANGDLTSVQLCHRDFEGPFDDRSQDIEAPHSALIDYKTEDGTSATIRWEQGGKLNGVQPDGSRVWNNYSDFAADLEKAGWVIQPPEWDCVVFQPATPITSLHVLFDSPLKCTCHEVPGNEVPTTHAQTWEVTIDYEAETDHETGPKDQIQSRPMTDGIEAQGRENFGNEEESPTYPNDSIGPEYRIPPNDGLGMLLQWQGPEPGPEPTLFLHVFNPRDAGGASDVQLYLDGIPVQNAFDWHDLDEDADHGDAQDFRFPLEGPHRQALLDGQLQLLLVHQANDGQFLALDAVGLDLGSSDFCAPDCDASGGLDLFDFLCFTNSFNAGQPYADCLNDGSLDLFDFLCFVNGFNDGC